MRFKAIPEEHGENIRENIVKSLSDFLDCEEDDNETEISKIYRINTRLAKLGNVPRDVLVQVARKKTRDQFYSSISILS